MNVKRILFPTDFSPCSEPALACASALAAQWDAQLFIVHVDDLPDAYIEGLSSGYGGHGYVDDPEQARHDIRGQLNHVSPSVEDISYEHRYLRGDPADELLKFAKVENIDVIVMGTHGRTAAMRLLMGSVAESIVRDAECEVITVKPATSAP